MVRKLRNPNRIIFLACIFAGLCVLSFCTFSPSTDEQGSSPSATSPPQQNTTASPGTLASQTPQKFEHTETVQALQTQHSFSLTQPATPIPWEPSYNPQIDSYKDESTGEISNISILDQTDSMVVYYSHYYPTPSHDSVFSNTYSKLCAWDTEFGYKEITPDFPETTNYFKSSVISNNQRYISYFFNEYLLDEDENGINHSTRTTLYIYDIDKGINIEILKENNPPDFFNDTYEILWVNSDRQILFLFPAHIEVKDQETGKVKYNPINRVFIYDLEEQSLRKITGERIINTSTYLPNANKVLLTYAENINSLDLKTLTINRLLDFEWVAVDTDYINTPDFIKHPTKDLYYIAVPRDVIYAETNQPISSTIYFYEIDGSTSNIRELAVIPDTLYTYDPPIFSPDGEWIVYKPKSNKTPYYFINPSSGEIEIRDISYQEFREMQNTLSTPTPDYGQPWLAGCPPKP